MADAQAQYAQDKFARALVKESRWTLTENGADALLGTGSDVLDMYASLAAMRRRPAQDWIASFERAYAQSPLLATRCLFYVRDIRGGQGERDIFRAILAHAAVRHPEAVVPNMHLVPEYGRWDDLFVLVGTPLEDQMWALVKAQLDADLEALESDGQVSLLAKWLKKGNSSNVATRKFGRYTAKRLGMTDVEYRRACVALRKHLGVVETQMSAGEWDRIGYSAVTSRAMMLYRGAFARHDGERFGAYLDSVADGKETINASTLYPYDIVEKVLYGHEDNAVLEAQWKALPDYVGEGVNMLVMADVSGSMRGRPMASAVALAMYFAEHNHGAYQDLFMTFSGRPSVVHLQGESLAERVGFISSVNWGFNTDLLAAFDLVLKIAVESGCTQEDLPRALVVVTDMEFDCATGCVFGSERTTFYQIVRERFAAAGYVAPGLVFWNIDARHDTFHAEEGDENVVMVAGQSASTFAQLIKYFATGEISTPTELMMAVLNSERYQPIQLAMPASAE